MSPPHEKKAHEREKDALRHCERAFLVFIVLHVAVFGYLFGYTKSFPAQAEAELISLQSLPLDDLLLKEISRTMMVTLKKANAASKTAVSNPLFKYTQYEALFSTLRQHGLRYDTSPPPEYKKTPTCHLELPGDDPNTAPEVIPDACNVMQIAPGVPNLRTATLEDIGRYVDTQNLLSLDWLDGIDISRSDVQAISKSLDAVGSQYLPGSAARVDCSFTYGHCYFHVVDNPDSGLTLGLKPPRDFTLDSVTVNLTKVINAYDTNHEVTAAAKDKHPIFLPKASAYWEEIKSQKLDRAIAILHGHSEQEEKRLSVFGFGVAPTKLAALVPLLSLAVIGYMILCLQTLIAALPTSGRTHEAWTLTSPTPVSGAAPAAAFALLPVLVFFLLFSKARQFGIEPIPWYSVLEAWLAGAACIYVWFLVECISGRYVFVVRWRRKLENRPGIARVFLGRA